MAEEQTSMFRIRAFEYPRDVERITTIANMTRSEPLTVENVLASERTRAAETVAIRLAAVNTDGLTVGYGEGFRSPWDTAGLFAVELVVDTAWRRRSAGALLWEALAGRLTTAGATRLEVEIRDNDPDSERFAQARGFALERHRFESTLDVASFDETPFAGVIERLETQGARFFSLADVGDTEEARRGDYEVNRRAVMDIPGRPQTFAPFEEWRRFVCEAVWYRPEGQIIAAWGEKWVGLAAVAYYPETNSMYNMITGVDRAYRGRGLSRALKLHTIRLARRYGVVSIRTHNDSANAPMLAINRKLGYQPQPGLLLYARQM
jgi:GNAT superfamily N-acetyltransferase